LNSAAEKKQRANQLFHGRQQPIHSLDLRSTDNTDTGTVFHPLLAPTMNSLKSSKSSISIARTTSSSGITVALLSLQISAATGFAQCGKDVVLTCSKTEYLNAAGVVQRTVDETSEIKIGKKEVTISPSDHDKMTGAITSTACDWKEPFKQGKTTVEATFKDDNGSESTATIIIEGKAGKITCSMKDKKRPDRIIQVSVDTFKEQEPAAKP
jgi:hypothetical protein